MGGGLTDRKVSFEGTSLLKRVEIAAQEIGIKLVALFMCAVYNILNSTG